MLFRSQYNSGLKAGANTAQCISRYKAELSTDGKSWTEVAHGNGSDAVTEIEFSPANAKFIRITQTGAVNGLFWSIHELQILVGPGTTHTAGR